MSNPIQQLGTFIWICGIYTDPNATMTAAEQSADGVDYDHPLYSPCYYDKRTAMPGYPQEHLEAAFLYVLERTRRAEARGNGARVRAVLAWLGRWERLILDELERREREGDKPAPPCRKSLKRSWVDHDKRRNALGFVTSWHQLPPLPPVEIDATWLESAPAGSTARIEIRYPIGINYRDGI